MGDVAEGYRALDALNKQEGRDRRTVAAEQYRQLAEECEPFGVLLRRNSETHYQLIGGGNTRWIVDIWPGRCRIRTSGKWPYGYLSLPGDWTLADVVQAVAAKTGGANA